MRKLLATLATLTLVFSSASIAGQTANTLNGQENKVSKQFEQSLNAPQLKSQIAKKLNVSAKELGTIKLKSMEFSTVADNSSSQFIANAVVEGPLANTNICQITGGFVANWLIMNVPVYNIPQLSQIWLNAINCLTD